MVHIEGQIAWPRIEPSLSDLLQHETFACTEAVVQQLLESKPTLAVLFMEYASEVLVMCCLKRCSCNNS